MKFELPGFKTIVREGIQVTVGFNANVSTQMGVSTVQETVTVTGESPIVDTKSTGTKQTFTTEMLQSIPSARDPWVILQQTAGIAMDRENIGGNMSGQQSNYMSRGAQSDQQQVVARRRRHHRHVGDGCVAELLRLRRVPGDDDQHRRRGRHAADGRRRHQPGDQERLATGSAALSRYYVTDEKFESQQHQRRRCASRARPPATRSRTSRTTASRPAARSRRAAPGCGAASASSTSTSASSNFYQPTPECQAFKTTSVALAASITDVNNCLNTDRTLLQTTNLKGEVQLFKGNKLSLFNNFAKKERNARGADDLHPIETTTPQGAVDAQFGKHWWNTGPNPTYKFGDQWVISDRLLVDVQYAHVGNNFILGFHSPRTARRSADAHRLDRTERPLRLPRACSSARSTA